MKTTMTAGPWVFAYGSVYQGTIETLSDENGLRIAMADRSDPRTMPTERDANMQAIAAVPELIRVLGLMTKMVKDGDLTSDVIEEAEEVLRKAGVVDRGSGQD